MNHQQTRKAAGIIIASVLGAFSLANGQELRRQNPQVDPGQPALVPLGVGTRTAPGATLLNPQNGDTKKTAYLGVVASSVMAPVRAQLGLQEGMGLNVDAVLNDGPAEKAGIKQYDVLKKFNDQILCNSDQLATLVHAAGKDTSVSLTLVRGGVEQTVNVTLGEHMETIPRGLYQARFPGGEGWTDGIGGFGAVMRESPQETGVRSTFVAVQPNGNEKANVLIQSSEDGKRTVKIYSGGDGKVFEGPLNSDQDWKAVPEKFRDQLRKVPQIAGEPGEAGSGEGTILVQKLQNGKLGVTIFDGNGVKVFDGPLNTEEDWKAIPEKYRDRVKKVQGQSKQDAQQQYQQQLQKMTDKTEGNPALSGSAPSSLVPK